MTGVFTFLLVIAAVVSTFHQCSSHRLTKENLVPTTTRSAENTVKTCLPHNKRSNAMNSFARDRVELVK
ncbi:unnamed protein product [Allacma fusca]|uniref:Secreted protein n=1 Tax=Allacma fusca TaxID=39272 RepID=A0A8J2KGC2_9HEXA|nr:unnamed protein product [Allacma fusca]